MTITAEVTQGDAISFLESAVRNWKFVPNLSTDDVHDVADALSRFAAKHRAQALAQGRLDGAVAIDNLGEALFYLSDKLRGSGFLNDDANRSEYESVVAAFQALQTKAQRP